MIEEALNGLDDAPVAIGDEAIARATERTDRHRLDAKVAPRSLFPLRTHGSSRRIGLRGGLFDRAAGSGIESTW
jgi:hypothetical protein